jgi:hypothetical protein
MRFLNPILTTAVLFMSLVATPALAKDYSHNQTGVSTYDPFAFFYLGIAWCWF